MMSASTVILSPGSALRVKDIDFSRRTIHVRHGKGGRDRFTILPESLADPLPAQLAGARQYHDADRSRNLPGVHLRGRITRPNPPRDAIPDPDSAKTPTGKTLPGSAGSCNLPA